MQCVRVKWWWEGGGVVGERGEVETEKVGTGG